MPTIDVAILEGYAGYYPCFTVSYKVLNHLEIQLVLQQ